MGQKLLAVMGISRIPTKKHAPKSINYGWEPLRTVMLDAGLRPKEIFRMRWENIYWDKSVVFNPPGESKKSRRLVPLTARVRAVLLARKSGVNEGWVFPSNRSTSGHIETVQKQWTRAKKLAGLPDSIVLYCARLTFSTDAMEGTGEPDGSHGCDGPQPGGCNSVVPASGIATDNCGDRAAQSGNGAMSTKTRKPAQWQFFGKCKNECKSRGMKLVALPGIEPGFAD